MAPLGAQQHQHGLDHRLARARPAADPSPQLGPPPRARARSGHGRPAVSVVRRQSTRSAGAAPRSARPAPAAPPSRDRSAHAGRGRTGRRSPAGPAGPVRPGSSGRAAAAPAGPATVPRRSRRGSAGTARRRAGCGSGRSGANRPAARPATSVNAWTSASRGSNPAASSASRSRNASRSVVPTGGAAPAPRNHSSSARRPGLLEHRELVAGAPSSSVRRLVGPAQVEQSARLQRDQRAGRGALGALAEQRQHPLRAAESRQFHRLVPDQPLPLRELGQLRSRRAGSWMLIRPASQRRCAGGSSSTARGEVALETRATRPASSSSGCWPSIEPGGRSPRRGPPDRPGPA